MDRSRERSHRHPDRGWEGRRGGPNHAQRGHSACGCNRGDVCFQAPRCDNGYGVREKRQLGGEQRHCGGYDRDVPREYKPGDSMVGGQVFTSDIIVVPHLPHLWENREYATPAASPQQWHTLTNGANGGYSVAPGEQHWSRPHHTRCRQREVFQPKLVTSNINFISAGVQNQRMEKKEGASSGQGESGQYVLGRHRERVSAPALAECWLWAQIL